MTATMWLGRSSGDTGQTVERALLAAEGASYVRGALHPLFATPRDRDAYVKGLLQTGGPKLAGNAAAFLRGWVEHR